MLYSLNGSNGEEDKSNASCTRLLNKALSVALEGSCAAVTLNGSCRVAVAWKSWLVFDDLKRETVKEKQQETNDINAELLL